MKIKTLFIVRIIKTHKWNCGENIALSNVTVDGTHDNYGDEIIISSYRITWNYMYAPRCATWWTVGVTYMSTLQPNEAYKNQWNKFTARYEEQKNCQPGGNFKSLKHARPVSGILATNRIRNMLALNTITKVSDAEYRYFLIPNG